jgi:hypothetical protein
VISVLDADQTPCTKPLAVIPLPVFHRIIEKLSNRLFLSMAESESTAPDPPPEEPLDPRAEKIRDELAGLVKSGLGVWRDTLESQDRLTKALADLQQEMDEINELSALPVFRGGLPLLEAGINRMQLCKKRVVAVGNRLKKLEANLQAKKQRQRQLEAQRAAKAPPKKEGPPEPPKESAAAAPAEVPAAPEPETPPGTE